MIFTTPNATKDASMFALQAILGISASQNLSVETAFAMLRGTTGFIPTGYDSSEDLFYVRQNWRRVLWKNVYSVNPAYPTGPHSESSTIGL
jgi:hypothetical protein